MSVDYESPNPIAHLVHEALQKGAPTLHKIRSLAAAVDDKGNSLFEKDRLGDRDPVKILECIMAGHPDLNEGLDALFDIANHGKVNQEPGRQPNLEYYVGCLRNGVNEPRPMVNVGCGPNPPDIAGVVNYDPFHKTPPKKKGLYVSNAYTDKPDDVLEVKYAPKGTWLSQDGYESVENDPDIAKCSRGVIQSFEPDKLPAGDRVDIVPNYRIWSENGMAVQVGEGIYQIPELHTVGVVAGGTEYDHSSQADAVLEVGWHLVLFTFYARVLKLMKHAQGAAIPKKMQDFPHLTSPGDDEKVGRVSEWMEKLNGQLIHLAVLRDGTAYEFTRGKSTGTMYRHSCPVDGHLLFERVTKLVEGKNVVTDYLVAGQWNNIKIPQKPSVIEAFCDKIQISGLGGDVVKPRPAYDQWEDGMEGLIGYIPTEWKSFYYKARKFVDVDIDIGTLRALPKLFAKSSLYLTQTDLSRRDPRAIYQVSLIEDKSVLEGRNGCDETIYTKAFRAEIGELRTDKKRPDPEGKIMNLVLQLRAEEIADRLNEEDL